MDSNGSKLFRWYVGIGSAQKPLKTAKKVLKRLIWGKKESAPPFTPLIKDKNLNINKPR